MVAFGSAALLDAFDAALAEPAGLVQCTLVFFRRVRGALIAVVLAFKQVESVFNVVQKVLSLLFVHWRSGPN